MATNNAVNVGLSGSTGSVSFVGSTSPTITTPTLTSPTLTTPTIGVATATSVTFSPTIGGIVGTTTNDNVTAGSVGQLISSVIADASPVSIAASGTITDITSISLTAGDWDVWGNINFKFSGLFGYGLFGWISSTSVTLPDPSLYNVLNFNTVGTLTNYNSITPPILRFSLSGTTTIYLTGIAAFTAGTCNARGGIYARRRR